MLGERVHGLGRRPAAVSRAFVQTVTMGGFMAAGHPEALLSNKMGKCVQPRMLYCVYL